MTAIAAVAHHTIAVEFDTGDTVALAGLLERLTRIGDTLRWDATVEDPSVLTMPWKMAPRTEILTDGMIYEQPICEERKTPHMVNKY